tara:strand:- start:2615 stop:2785 length:171 start_codon:yes stop_codon:yes gene_type:complete
MSRTYHKERASKRGIGKEYWKSRLHKHGEVTGRFTKKLTHRKERRAGKAEEIKEED